MGRFERKVCVIAGIGGEIGQAVATRLVSEGAVVVGIDRRRLDVPFPVVTADLAVVAAFEQIQAEFSRIDVLHNNAGPLDREDRGLAETSAETWARVFRGVLDPVVLASKHAIPIILRNGDAGGSIINTGSFLAGMGAATAQVAFSAAKAAVTQVSLDLGMHLARTGVRVNAIALGPVETSLVREMFTKLGPEGTARRLTHVPTGRFATVDEVAGAVAYLAGEDSGYVTASVFPVHGGIPNGYTIPE